MKYGSICRLVGLAISVAASSAQAGYLFTDGTGFAPTVTRGGTAQPIGQFTMSNGETSAQYTFTGVTIRLDGTRTGLSNFKLRRVYQNVQMGSIVAADPGDGNTVSFTFSDSLPGGYTYAYELSANVASNATGSVAPVIPSTSNITATVGSSGGGPSSSSMSSSSVPLPVAMSGFSAE